MASSSEAAPVAETAHETSKDVDASKATAADTGPEHMEHESNSGDVTTPSVPKPKHADGAESTVGEEDAKPERTGRQQGMACIKQEFIDFNHKRVLVEDYLPKEIISQLKQEAGETSENVKTGEDEEQGPPKKKMKVRGRNKNRKGHNTTHIKNSPGSRHNLCNAVVDEVECRFGEKCNKSHDVAAFMASKPKDLGDRCVLFEKLGKCPYGISCCFAMSHLTEDYKNIVNEELWSKMKDHKFFINQVTKELQDKLRNKSKQKLFFEKAEKAIELTKARNFDELEKLRLSYLEPDHLKLTEKQSDTCTVIASNGAKDAEAVAKGDSNTDAAEGLDIERMKGHGIEISADGEGIKFRPQEKKQIDFHDKLYLAPLTTVGNLPFRRICKGLGADITCGEMALATNLLQAQRSEWALIKRHESEDLFGVQLCGSFPDSMTRCAQMLTENCDIDFIDINCGCPIDFIFKRGEGSALMGRKSKLEEVVRGMRSVMGETPLTMKIRTGIYENKLVARDLVPALRDWGVSCVTLHGRTREQRYTKLADWDYINQCAELAAPMPLYGNGDILSYEDANLRREQTNVAGIMVARGALIKPWIFTEIKEQRHWDISANERFDILKNFVNHGLEHWGSDLQGVNNTRRFLLEWLSFTYRYIPVGLLERPPQHINEKPPYYFGRNDLETLMASSNASDWVKISEMLLGPVPEGFFFVPKHKASAYK